MRSSIKQSIINQIVELVPAAVAENETSIMPWIIIKSNIDLVPPYSSLTVIVHQRFIRSPEPKGEMSTALPSCKNL